MDIENELCLKCQNISIDTDETSSKSSSNSPISQNLKQIENELSKRTTSGSLASLNENNYNFKYLETFLSDLPINIIEIPIISTTTNEMMCSIESISSNESQQFVLNNNKNKLIDTKNTFSLLLSSSSSNNNKPIIKRRIKEKTSPNTKLKTTTTTMDTSVNTPLRMLGKNSVSTTKKRSWDSTSSTEILNSTDIINNNTKLDIEPKTPKTKRRLIMSTTNQSMLQSPSTTTYGTANSCNNIASPKPNSKTILHYFSPVIQPK